MITRMYPNAKGEVQSVTLSQDEWEAISEADLDKMLGFGHNEPAAAPTPAPKKKPAKGAKK
jgi:hypothetical protein